MGKPLVYEIEGVTEEDWYSMCPTDIPSTRPSGIGTNPGDNRVPAWDNVDTDWNARGFRLPTSWEWQWAAMGGVSCSIHGPGTFENPNNDGYRKAFAGASAVQPNGRLRTGRSQHAWLSINDAGVMTARLDGVRPVGLLLPNELGLYDMSGNVFEWVYDRVNGANNQAVNTTETINTDWTGQHTPWQRRLGHGGDWWNDDSATFDRPSIWNRTGYWPSGGYDQSGIRLVINAE